MIRKVTVERIDGKGGVLTLPFNQNQVYRYILKNISGLGPVKAELNTSKVATKDGIIYNSQRIDARNLVFDIMLRREKDSTIESSRQSLYGYFPRNAILKFTFYTDNTTVYCTGYVESNEPTMFDETSTQSISVICPNPYFYDIESNTISLNGILKSFEFPFENKLSERTIEFGTIVRNSTGNIYYTGSQSIGVEIIISFSGDVSGLQIYNANTREKMEFNNYIFRNKQKLHINSQRGEKSIMLFDGGNATNILNYLTNDSEFIHLENGDNVFAYKATSGSEHVSMMINNKVIYEGI